MGRCRAGSNALAAGNSAICPSVQGLSSIVAAGVARHSSYRPAAQQSIATLGGPEPRAPTTELKVVVGVDGSEDGRIAAEWAAAEADRRGVPLRLVNAYSAPVELYPIGGMVSAELATSARQWSQHTLLHTERHIAGLFPNLAIQAQSHYGNPVSALKDESRYAVMTVVGSHGAHQLADALLGSVAARVAAHADGPVVVVRTHPALAAPPNDGDVVVGVDPSPHAHAAIGFAFEEAALRGARLVALHGGDSGPLLRAMASIPLEVRLTEHQAVETGMLADQLAGWTDKYPQVEVQRIVRTGLPASELVARSVDPNVKTQLIVVGSRGLGGFAGLLLGSTGAALIAHARCPVAVVRDHTTPKLP
jgi:nucleotide-binding universal stress UspA family protein